MAAKKPAKKSGGGGGILLAVAVVVALGAGSGGGFAISDAAGTDALSTSRIDHLMLRAGFPRSQLATGEKIVHAESSGRPDATNHNPNGSTDYGLWQINSVHSGLLKSHDWRDPLENTKMAYAVWKDSGWDAWSTYGG
jgi:hypothetical protein